MSGPSASLSSGRIPMGLAVGFSPPPALLSDRCKAGHAPPLLVAGGIDEHTRGGHVEDSVPGHALLLLCGRERHRVLLNERAPALPGTPHRQRRVDHVTAIGTLRPGFRIDRREQTRADHDVDLDAPLFCHERILTCRRTSKQSALYPQPSEAG